LMSDFVGNTHQSENDFADSLRLAKMTIKNNTQWQHPYYWAPFVLVGTY